MLEKRLTLGGLQVGGQKTLQNPARFRKANNVYQTLDGRYIPRFDNEELVPALPSGIYPVNVKIFKGQPFVIARDDNDSWKYRFYYGNPAVEIVNTVNFGITWNTTSAGDDISFGIQFTEKNGLLFFNIPIYGPFKFDGVKVVRAGVPTAYGSVGGPTGIGYYRIVQMTLDFNGGVVYSGYTQFSSGNNGSSTTVNGATDRAENRQAWDKIDVGYDDFYYFQKEATTPTASGGEVEIELAPGGYNLVPGCWVQWYGAPFGALQMHAIRCDRIVGDTAYFNKLRIYDGENWGDEADIFNAVYVPEFATNQWLTIWTSDQETGVYVYKGFCGYREITTINVSDWTNPMPLSSLADVFNISEILGDWYDVTSVKFPFPSVDERLASTSATVYGELLCIAGEREVYFSDTTLGGNFEMTNGLAFLTTGEEENGAIQSISGTSSFLLISQKYKNYYVAGNLPTGNYQVQPISQTSLGAYSNQTSISINDSVIFLNKSGIWSLTKGGRCERVSDQVSGLFHDYSATTDYAEELVWNIDDYGSFVIPYDGLSAGAIFNEWVKLRYDNMRNLLFFVIRGNDDRGSALVLNMNNGEFYTWDKIVSGKLNDITFHEGEYYASDDAAIVKEEKSGAGKYDYFADSKPELVTTWFTAAEPSLEKKLKQVKMFGQIEGSVTVTTYMDWKDATVASSEYTNSAVGLFSHKKRLDSQNVLAASVGLEFNGTKFELDGIELEFSPFQVGMKR